MSQIHIYPYFCHDNQHTYFSNLVSKNGKEKDTETRRSYLIRRPWLIRTAFLFISQKRMSLKLEDHLRGEKQKYSSNCRGCIPKSRQDKQEARLTILFSYMKWVQRGIQLSLQHKCIFSTDLNPPTTTPKLLPNSLKWICRRTFIHTLRRIWRYYLR